MSNVNLSSALTELLIMQKAFDANAKSITTSDQMIQKAIEKGSHQFEWKHKKANGEIFDALVTLISYKFIYILFQSIF